jgi:hypothetical protein
MHSIIASRMYCESAQSVPLGLAAYSPQVRHPVHPPVPVLALLEPLQS